MNETLRLHNFYLNSTEKKKGTTQENSALDANKNAFTFMKIKLKYIFIQALVKLLGKPFFKKISFKSMIS